MTEAAALALDRMRDAVVARALTPFVGAGFSSAATEGAACASWRGLLLNGIEVCDQVVSPLPPGWVDRMKDYLDNADVFSYLAVADEITRRLRAVRGGRDFNSWIDKTVGTLRATPSGRKLVKAVCDLGDIVVTTNYDNVIEEAQGWQSFTWTDNEYAQTAARGNQAVLHLHGDARKPHSIILGSADYERFDGKELTQVLNKSLFASRRFLFVGCGDGLNDPDLAPLIDFLNRVMPEEDTEHYILVRGDQLRQHIQYPLSPMIVPIAYGGSFRHLTPFLAKLAEGKEISTSQAPKIYEQPAGTALLDLASRAQDKLQRALDALERAMRAMGRVERRGAMPREMETWEDYVDQETVHRQLAASVTDPAAHLDSCLVRVVLEFESAEIDVGRLTAAQFTEHAARLGPMIETVAELEDQSGLLLTRVTEALDDLKARTKLCSDYQIPHKILKRVFKSIDQTNVIAISLKGGLDRLRPDHQIENTPALPSASQRPDLYMAAVEQSPAAEPDFQRVPVLGNAAAGRPIPIAGEDPEYLYVALPDQYVHRTDVFAVKVKGDSMSGDRLLDGDYVIVVQDTEPNNGAMVLILVEGIAGVEEGEAIVKRWRRDGATIRLESSNDDFEPIVLEPDSRAIIQGRVIGIVRWHSP